MVAVYIFNNHPWLKVIHSPSCFSSALFLLSLSSVANNCEWFPVSCCKAINQISLQIWLTHSVDAASGSKGLTYQHCLCGKNNNNPGQKYLIFHRLSKVFPKVLYIKYLFLLLLGCPPCLKSCTSNKLSWSVLHVVFGLWVWVAFKRHLFPLFLWFWTILPLYAFRWLDSTERPLWQYVHHPLCTVTLLCARVGQSFALSHFTVVMFSSLNSNLFQSWLNFGEI